VWEKTIRNEFAETTVASLPAHFSYLLFDLYLACASFCGAGDWYGI
jgi:hypothetical protein